jgi:hypothetical protein
MSLAVKPVYSGRAFVRSCYHADIAGKPRPIRPKGCPGSEEECWVQALKWRERKHGPGYELSVYRCRTHRRIFTVYPPDWTPYARKPFVGLSPEGEDGIPDGGVNLAWAATVFQAVIDASEGRRWPIEASFIPDNRGLIPGGVFRTQCRHIEGALSLFAINDGADRRAQEKVAASFGIGLPFIVELTHIRDGPWWKKTGEAGAKILHCLGSPGRRHVHKLVDLGVDRKYWGPAPPLLSRAFG